MKTYTVDADGVPALAFRAKDDDAAATWLTGWVGKWYAGTFAVRNKALKIVRRRCRNRQRGVPKASGCSVNLKG